MAIRIFLVDDHPIILNSLRDMLGATKKHEVIGTAASVARARDMIRELRPDIAIIDLTLEDGSGMGLIEDLHSSDPEIRLIVYSMRGNIQTISDAYRAGAMAYVPKSGDPYEVVHAVSAAAKGRYYFVGDVEKRLMQYHSSGDPDDPFTRLSSREFQIFRLAAQGLVPEEIGARLGIGAPSVLNRLVTIRKKLGLSNQAQFTRLALRYGHMDADSFAGV